MTSSKSNSKEPYDEFIATIKLVTGEEILTKVIVNNDDNEDQIILDHPLICHEVRSVGANAPMGYKFEPWMKMSDEDTFILNMNNIITISEIKDNMVLGTYNDVVQKGFSRDPNPEITRDMGYLNSVNRSRTIIEKLYKGEDASKEPKS